MSLLKIIILLSLILLPSIGYCADVDWKTEAIKHFRLNIVLCINIALFIIILLCTFLRFRLLKNKNKSIFQQSSIDSLTNILNRNGFHRQLESIPDKNGSLLIIDIDNFKSINDRFGHNIGDKVLQRVAHTLKSQIRDNDILGRYGGEEFFIFISHQDVTMVKTLADRLVTAIANLDIKDIDPQLEQITISIGVDKGNAEPDNFEHLYQSTDKFLYRAKNTGKNKAVIGFATAPN
ncbi:GGDEF domain-containing protein [Pseudoalteromonas mariniglutinosa]